MRNNMSKFGFSLTELLVVIGIFFLVIGASFALLSSGRLSVSIGEAQIQAKECARLAMDRISRELRLSSSEINNRMGQRICVITNGLTSTANVSGNVIYFQVPVEAADGTLDLRDNTLKWGTREAEDQYICYFLGGPAADQLFKSTSSSVGTATTASGVIIAPNISSINFSRQNLGADLIDIEIVGRGQATSGEITQTLRSSIKLRN